MQEQAVSRLILNDGSILTKCDQCIATYSERNPPEEPPCEDCRVELMKENQQAAYIYQIVSRQVRTIFNGERSIVTDLDFNAVFNVMDRIPGGVKDEWGCFEKIMSAFYYFLKERDKNENS